MEFPELGKNCQWSECKVLDFLPFQCNHCKAVFCKDHFQPEAHLCDSVATTKELTKGDQKNVLCSFLGCKAKDVVEMLCVKCYKHFCLTHRYHNCFQYSTEEIEEARKKLNAPRQQYQNSLTEVVSQINKKIETIDKTSKNYRTALKVQLMRLKGKAVGPTNVPAEERVYFLVFPPKRLKLKSKAVYCCNKWSVGRAIDAFANLTEVPNHNNEANAKKLRLFKKRNGEPLSQDMGLKLSILFDDGSIDNGESLILEYIAPEESLDGLILENLSDYVD